MAALFALSHMGEIDDDKAVSKVAYSLNAGRGEGKTAATL
jgi:hypothetical protein